MTRTVSFPVIQVIGSFNSSTYGVVIDGRLRGKIWKGSRWHADIPGRARITKRYLHQVKRAVRDHYNKEAQT